MKGLSANDRYWLKAMLEKVRPAGYRRKQRSYLEVNTAREQARRVRQMQRAAERKAAA